MRRVIASCESGCAIAGSCLHLALFYGGPIAMHVFKQNASHICCKLPASSCLCLQAITMSGCHIWQRMGSRRDNDVLSLCSLYKHTRGGMVPGLWPYIWSCVIMKVRPW